MPNFDVTRIAGNIGALNSLNSLTNINKQLATHQARLSSGKRINTAEDDPAGLTIATKLLARSEGLKVALSNIGDAKNLLAVAESGLGRINDLLVQIRNKAETGASDTMGNEERKALLEQIKAYSAQIDDIAKQTKWNDKTLINGSFSSDSLTFQTGSDAGDTTTLTGLSNMSATDANGGVGDSLSIAMKSGAGVTATEATDGDSILASVTGAGTAANSNLSLLASGTYTVRVTYGGTAGSSSDIELLDSAGNAMYIAATPADGTGNVTKKLTAQDLDTGPVTVNFGNGLSVGLAAKANGTYTATVNFTAGGTYDIFTEGDTGTKITDGTLTAANFSAYMSHIQGKINSVSTQLSAIGALNGRLSFKEDQVSTSQINVESAYNRIMNANMAEEQVNASKYQILQQTAAAMLAQANSAPQFVLNLFR